MKALHSRHSAYTPSHASPETLRALLVGREDILRRITEGLRRSAHSSTKQQYLLIGPRGIGKTHLLSLVFHALRAEEETATQLRIAWIPEDPYIHTFLDLLLEILQALAREYPEDYLDKRILKARQFKERDHVETALIQLLKEITGDRTLLLLAENLHEVFRRIGESGQHKLRAHVQNSGQVCILATATSLFDAVTKRSHMFFGFFHSIALEPLDTLGARDLLVRLAQLNGETELEGELRGSRGLARVRAMHELAGGNPRICTLFYQMLTRDSLNELVAPFLELVDELMPYYQSRMADLSDQQSRIVQALCRQGGAMAPAELADELHASTAGVDAQAKRLEGMGYLLRIERGAKARLYRLREPLMRFTLMTKEDRGQYLRTVVEMLRLWYSPPELNEAAKTARSESERRYLVQAALMSARDGDPLRSVLHQEFISASADGNHDTALEKLDLRLARNSRDMDALQLKAKLLGNQLKRPEAALNCWTELTATEPEAVGHWIGLAEQHFELGQLAAAVAAMRQAERIKPTDPAILRLLAWYLKCDGLAAEAADKISRLVESAEEPNSADAWHQRARDLLTGGLHNESVAAYFAALALDPQNSDTWHYLLGMIQHVFWRDDLCGRLTSLALTIRPEDPLFSTHKAIIFARDLPEDQLLIELRAIEIRFPAFCKTSKYFQIVMAAGLVVNGQADAALNYLSNHTFPDSRREQIEQLSVQLCAQMSLARWDAAEKSLAAMLSDGVVLANWFWLGPENMIRATSTAMWSEAIACWIRMFKRHSKLTVLGQILCLGARKFASSRSHQPHAAREWLDCLDRQIKVTGEDAKELRLAWRVLDFAWRYRDQPDPLLIQALPVEERLFLEPGLQECLAPTPTAFEKDLMAHTDLLAARVKAMEERRAREALWRQEPPATGDVMAQITFVSSDVLTDAYAWPLLPGSWREIELESTAAVLKNAAEASRLVRQVLARPGLQVLRLRERSITDTASNLYQLDIAEAGKIGAIDFVCNGAAAVVLSGQSWPLHEMVAKKQLSTHTPASRWEFVALFCAAVRGPSDEGSGRFRFLQAHELERIDVTHNFGIQGALALNAIQDQEDGNSTYVGLIHYADQVFSSRLQLGPPGSSQLEMMEDTSVANWGMHEEVFDGPIRWVWRKPLAAK